MAADNEQKARELLADECRKEGLNKVARDIELGMHASHFVDIALRAIKAAAQSAQLQGGVK